MLDQDAKRRRDEESRYESHDPARRHVEHRARRRGFDRIAFAMRVLDILEPREKVVVYRRRDDFVVERGSQFSRGRVRRYSLIGIPLGATRHQIAYELACLVGLEVVPYTVTALVEEASGRVKGSQRPYRVPTRPIR